MSAKGHPNHVSIAICLDPNGARDPNIHHHADGTTSLGVWIGGNHFSINGTRNQLAQLQTYIGHAIADADAKADDKSKSMPQSAFQM